MTNSLNLYIKYTVASPSTYLHAGSGILFTYNTYVLIDRTQRLNFADAEALAKTLSGVFVVSLDGISDQTAAIGEETLRFVGQIPVPGANTQVIFNDAGALNGDANLTWDKTAGLLNVTGNIQGSARVIQPTVVEPPAVTTTTVNGILTLGTTSPSNQILSGSASGFSVKLPDATTLPAGICFSVWNTTLQPVVLLDGSSLQLLTIPSQSLLSTTLEINGTVPGVWATSVPSNQNIVDFIGSNDGFEDFMFDAYAGAGGNDNQYSFTPATNSGSSNIDGAISAIGNDYEGIHILDSLTSAVSRPLLDGFGGYSRIKLGAQTESYEIRVRIETLADVNQKFTTRYGLMDISTIGMPANGVLFSYDPVYPVTAVAQVVTVTPNSFPVATYQVVTGTPNVSSQAINQHFIQNINSTVYDYNYLVDQVVTVTPNSFPVATYQVVTGTPSVASNAPSQTFTQNINGSDYTYNYSTPQVATITPNSFPVATFEQISVTWTRANNTLYTVTINGTACSYTSDASATDVEIALGLGNAINAAVGAAVTAGTTGKPILVTSDILGTGFTYSSSANVTITLVTANVPKGIYTETINGTPYAFTSDGTPTAAEVVTGLTALINADGTCPSTASGTTTLILTGKVSGNSWTYSGSTNLTQADSTAFPVATTIVTALKSSINADGPLPVTASGASTLILTSDILGTAFTYLGTLITDVLTTANVPIEVYTQTINGTPYTYTSDGTPTATEVCNGLRALMAANPSVDVSGTTTLIITGKVAGVTFTYSGSSNLTEALSNPTLTAAIVVTGLTGVINADPSRVVQATGTTTLILTSNILGTAFTYSGTLITDVLTTANVPIEVYTQTINGVPYVYTSDGTPTATEVCNGLRALINIPGHTVSGTGTTTLILTADVPGTPFTYSGTGNLTEVLTTSNVPGVAYSGNWLITSVNSSTATTLNSGVPAVAGKWYRLKAIINDTGTQVFFYVDNVYVGVINTAITTAALRYIFKLEKTLGTVSRTTSIDYICWRRTRA